MKRQQAVERKSKVFWWANSATMRAKQVTVSPLPGSWWCDEAGEVVYEGRQLFETKAEALKELLREAKLKRDWYEGAIVELSDQLKDAE